MFAVLKFKHVLKQRKKTETLHHHMWNKTKAMELTDLPVICRLTQIF